MTRRHFGVVIAAATALTIGACQDATAPARAVAKYSVTLLPTNTVTKYTDDASFVLYRLGPSVTTFSLDIRFGLNADFDQCGLTSMAAVLGPFPVNGTGVICDITPSPFLLTSSRLQIPGTLDETTSVMTIESAASDRLTGSFVLNFRSSTGIPSARVEGSFSATSRPCQSPDQCVSP